MSFFAHFSPIIIPFFPLTLPHFNQYDIRKRGYITGRQFALLVASHSHAVPEMASAIASLPAALADVRHLSHPRGRIANSLKGVRFDGRVLDV